MKKTILTLLFCGLALTAYSQTPSKNDKIKKMMEQTGVGKLGVQAAKNMMVSLRKAYPNVDERFWDEFEKEMSVDELINLIVPIYAKYYSEEEIDQLISFYNTPIGRKVIETLPQISKESMTAGESWGRQIGEKVIRKLKDKGYTTD
jgi:hypothetical protein